MAWVVNTVTNIVSLVAGLVLVILFIYRLRSITKLFKYKLPEEPVGLAHYRIIGCQPVTIVKHGIDLSIRDACNPNGKRILFMIKLKRLHITYKGMLPDRWDKVLLTNFVKYTEIIRVPDIIMDCQYDPSHKWIIRAAPVNNVPDRQSIQKYIQQSIG